MYVCIDVKLYKHVSTACLVESYAGACWTMGNRVEKWTTLFDYFAVTTTSKLCQYGFWESIKNRWTCISTGQTSCFVSFTCHIVVHHSGCNEALPRTLTLFRYEFTTRWHCPQLLMLEVQYSITTGWLRVLLKMYGKSRNCFSNGDLPLR